ncbi:MAG TPA: adenylate/guanylate cyclase domain-containing protein [Anaerolineales bacterium]
MSTLPSGTVTFLFTDLEGSTKLWEQFPGAMKSALARHDDILQRAITTQGGHIIKSTGDGFHAAFDTCASALAAALTAQQDMQHAGWEEIQPHRLRVRMGIHTGEAQERSGDFYGPALNRAARLMSIAHGGQTLLSATTADLVRDQLPDDASLKDLGEHRLRDLVRSEHVFQLAHPALPSEFPPLRSVDAFPNNLPVQLTSFIGRERELEAARKRLASSHLLTLIGPGGTGKTRLSLQLAADVLPSFSDGVWLAELAPLTDPALVIQTVGSILHLREQLGMPLEELLIDYLREKNVLLVLDNCEHLIDACAHLADRLLHACGNLKMIASSREALGIAGEAVYRVPPLSLPDAECLTRRDFGRCESGQLFVERASAANPRFSLTDQNAAAIAQICRRLDGIPLALELAAARITTFSAEQIASHLDDRFRLLTGGSRTALPRQQTLRALIDWSYELLPEQERTLMRKLSVFAGGWTFEAAEAVCSDLNVLDLLPQLVNKSLVAVDTETDPPRYRLFETVRQYARDKLLEQGETESARTSHFDYFLGLATQAAPRLRKSGASEWVTKLELEHDNLRNAMQWGLEERLDDVLRMVSLLSYFWNRRGYEEEARSLIREALQRANSQGETEGQAGEERPRLLCDAWGILGLMAFSQGDNLNAVAACEQSAAIARRLGDHRRLAIAITFQVMGALSFGQIEGVDALLKEGLAAAEASGDTFALGLVLTLHAVPRTPSKIAIANLGQVTAEIEKGRILLKESGDEWSATMGLLSSGMLARFRGEYEMARKQFATLEPLFLDLGDKHRTNMIRSELAHIERYEGRYEKAEAMYRETLPEWQRLGHRAAVAHQIECFAAIAHIRGERERAARLYGAAERLRERINIPMTELERAEYDLAIARLRSETDEAVFTSSWAAGRALSIDQAIRLALEPTLQQPG